MTGNIYFIASEKQDAFKVGYCSNDPDTRLAQLQSGNPDKLTLIGWLYGTRRDEGLIHTHIAKYQRGLEWFGPVALGVTIFDELEEESYDADDELQPLTPEVIDERVPVAIDAHENPEF